MAERLTTGLAGLDAQLGGGVPPGSVHVLIGEPMNAFELFPYHFAAGGTKVAKGVDFVTTQGDEEMVMEGIERVGGEPSKVKLTSLEARKTLPDARAGNRMIIDTFSGLVANAGWDGPYDQLVKLKAKVRKSGDNLLVTVAAGMHEPREMLWIKTWADGVMELGFDRQGFGLYPFLKVTKMRGVPDSSRFLLFKETEKGLFMESTKRVF